MCHRSILNIGCARCITIVSTQYPQVLCSRSGGSFGACGMQIKTRRHETSTEQGAEGDRQYRDQQF